MVPELIIQEHVHISAVQPSSANARTMQMCFVQWLSVTSSVSWPNRCCRQKNHLLRLQRSTTYSSCQLSRHSCTALARAADGSRTDAQQLSQSLPENREQAIKQASEAIAAQLDASAPKSKGFKTSGVKKLAVDVPVADQTAPAVAQLVTDILKGLPRNIVDQLTVVFADESRTEAAKKIQKQAKQKYKAIYLGDAFVEGISGWLMVVEPKLDQVEKVDVLLSQWRGRAIIVLNAEWTVETVDPQFTAFVKSFDSVYSFLPLAIQGFILKTEAVIFKKVSKGSPTAAPWYVFVKAGKGHTCIARQQQRPTSENLELAYYNYKASESPITKGVKFFKNVIPGKK